jgi:flavin reductase (DIM6/NTAB) family NADH-FMN oxidoreductase RutF
MTMRDTAISNAKNPVGDEEQFKQAFSVLASGVSVVTFDVGSHVHGFTATSVTPVSMSPPLALFCVACSNMSHEHLDRGTVIGISILAANQVDISNRFAAKVHVGGYVDVEVNRGSYGAPLLSGSIAELEGEITEMLSAGDHTICICAITSSRSSIKREPLLYHSRGYHTLAELRPS